MADIDELGINGLQTKDNTVLLNDLQTSFQDIYGINGEQINFNSNTPDGNITEIMAEIGTVVRELITEVYNSCDPSKCSGAVQDNRYQINYLFRKAGRYSTVNIDITTDRTVTLDGLDNLYDDENASSYAVTDDAGNVWYLITSTTLYSGTTRCAFRAKNIGEVIPVIGTITNQVTVVPGVVKVINNVGYTTLGEEQETDNEFRIRRDQSVSKSSTNTADAIRSKILTLADVTECAVWVNNTNSTDSTGTLAHYIWCIVAFDGEPVKQDIANIIYENIAGSGTRGNITVPLNTSSMQTININFDKPITVPLYIKFDIQPITDPGEIDQTFIKGYIAKNLVYRIGESAETSNITTICAEALTSDGGNGYALNVQISTGGTASVTTTSSTISNLVVNTEKFQAACSDTAGSYVFTYTATGWQLSSDDVDLDTYGISYTGTPALSDTITVAYTASVWTDYITVSSIADCFKTDENKININVVV